MMQVSEDRREAAKPFLLHGSLKVLLSISATCSKWSASIGTI